MKVTVVSTRMEYHLNYTEYKVNARGFRKSHSRLKTFNSLDKMNAAVAKLEKKENVKLFFSHHAEIELNSLGTEKFSYSNTVWY